MWQVASHTSPPHTVYVMSHGDVMITRDSQAPVQAVPVPQIEASKLTKQAFDTANPQEWDPWMPAAKQLPSYKPPTATAAAITPLQMRQLEQTIEQKIMDKMMHGNKGSDDEPMEEVLGPKVAALETQLQQLSAAHDETRQKTNQMQTSIERIHKQIETQGTRNQAFLEEQMQSQMAAIDALLTKRLRTSHE